MKYPCSSSIRPMQFQDLQRVTLIHLESFPFSRSTLLGEKFVYNEYNWFFNYYSKFAFVYIDREEVVGFVIGASNSYSAQLFRDLLPGILIALLSRPWLFFKSKIYNGSLIFVKSFLRKFSLQKRETEKFLLSDYLNREVSFTLASIAVSPLYRCRGIGRVLLTAFENHTFSVGLDKLRLTVLEDNLKARRFYEKSGWNVFSTQNGAVHLEKTRSKH